MLRNKKIVANIIHNNLYILFNFKKLINKNLPEVDFIVTAEAKGIPLAYEISRILNLNEYIVARKSIKAYMEEPIEVEVNSITTTNSQKLYLNNQDANKIKGKRVVLIDDVISTGQSLKALERLVEKAGANVVAKAAILAEGDAKDRKDIIFLEALPTF